MMRYVIVGGDAAGMSAAMEITRHDETAEITTLEKGDIYSYGQCGLPYVIDGRISSPERVIARRVETFREKYGIDARTRHEVTNVDVEKKEVSGINHHTGEPFTVPYDRLLIATGASPLLPAWEGMDLEGIQPFKDIPLTKQLLEAMEDVETITVIGGGYIGLEVAEALTNAGKKIRLIQRGERVANIFDPFITDQIEEKAREKGIELLLNESVESFSGEGRVEKVHTDKGTYETDYVIVAVGVRPATQFIDIPELHRLPNGAIITNEQMETSIPDVYAAGDCAAQFHRVKGKHDYIPLGTTANKQGRVAGLSMAGWFAQFKGIVGTSITQFFDLQIARTGLSEAEIQAMHRPYEMKQLTAYHIAGYYPGAEKITVRLYFDQLDRTLLGAQVIGKAGVDKRTDVIATALYAGLTIDDLLDLDLSYAPPFNGAWDPVQQIARRVQP